MANIPVNIDMHILDTAEYFPNLLGPLMINDYIQGLNVYRKGDDKHVREFILQQSVDQHDKFNRQRYLTTTNGGDAYEGWCNRWFLSGQNIRALFDGIFEHVQNIKVLA